MAKCSGSFSSFNLSLSDAMTRESRCRSCGRRVRLLRVWKTRGEFGSGTTNRGLFPAHERGDASTPMAKRRERS